MGRSVVHFEVVGRDADALRSFYGTMFGWETDVQEQFNYGLIDREANTNRHGVGISGGIGYAPEGYDSHVTFYVEVPDVEAALAQAESLGGTRVMGPETLMPGVTLGQFKDPEGHVIGVLQEMP
jgi:hypothetical protein